MKSNPYARVDKIINALNRKYVIEFNIAKSKLTFDELNVMKIIRELYKLLYKETLRYYKTLIKAEDPALTNIEAENLLKGIVSGFNPVTQYIFENEFERKGQKLAEAILSKYEEKDDILAHHLKWLARQMAQGAIDTRDVAIVNYYRNNGIKNVIWVTAEDEKVCKECRELDGNIYSIKNIPSKPHFNCRCYVVPEE